jgi:methanethiol S-methyltransferase
MDRRVTTGNHDPSSIVFDGLVLKLTPILGWASLILFMAFLYKGSLNIVDLGLADRSALALNAFLSLTFFIQHSGMIRQSFRQWIARFMDEKYNAAVFSLVSSITLIVFALLWQDSRYSLASAQGPERWLLRTVFIACVFGFYWGGRSLGAFDPFGVGSIRRGLTGRPVKPPVFVVAGPYRWVRHPLYFLTLVMIWSCPDLTADRVLFNVLWTVWIVVGTMLEERDLVRFFGQEYRNYQTRVPMLIPVTIRPIYGEPGEKRT